VREAQLVLVRMGFSADAALDMTEHQVASLMDIHLAAHRKHGGVEETRTSYTNRRKRKPGTP